MPVVYVREPHEQSRREVLVDHVDGLPVKDLKEIISQRLHVPAEEQSEDVENHIYQSITSIYYTYRYIGQVIVGWEKCYYHGLFCRW